MENELKADLRKVLLEQLIKENYQVSKELEKVSTEVLTFILKLWVNAREVDMAYEIHVKDVVKPQGYDKLKGFLTGTNLIIEFIEAGPGGVAGAFFHSPEPEDRNYRIQLAMSSKEEDMINKELIGYDEEEEGINRLVYWCMNQYYKTMVHELQHAFDAFRSNNSNDYHQQSFDYQQKAYKGKKAAGKDYQDMTPQDMKDYQTYMTAYYKLPHEISARFTHTVRDLNVTELTRDERPGSMKRVIRPFSRFLEDFQRKFEGYDKMRERVKKNLIRRLYKYYEEAVEDFQEQQKNGNK